MNPKRKFLVALVTLVPAAWTVAATPDPIEQKESHVLWEVLPGEAVSGDGQLGGAMGEPAARPVDRRPLFDAQLLKVRYALTPSLGRERWIDLLIEFSSLLRPQVRPLDAAADSLFPTGMEEAERINAEAMRRYQERWERYLKAPGASSVPVLYLSKLRAMLGDAE